MSYTCKRCHHKPYAQKKALLKHLISKTECPATYSDISRSDLYKIVKDPHYLKKLKLEAAKSLDNCVSNVECHPLQHKKDYKTILSTFPYKKYSHWEVKDWNLFKIGDLFNHYFKRCIYRGPHYIHVLYYPNQILLYEPDDFSELIYEFLESLAEKLYKVETWTNRGKLLESEYRDNIKKKLYDHCEAGLLQTKKNINICKYKDFDFSA